MVNNVIYVRADWSNTHFDSRFVPTGTYQWEKDKERANK